ncbi:MAG: hypothetical protein OHK0011_23020 [Turneriella sp.]
MNTNKDQYSANNLGPFAENFIIVAIIFALFITILDEFATLLQFSLSSRNIILVASFITDLLFTGEFIARTVVTKKHGAFRHYMMHQRGWVDLISSVPLLLLSSGPEILLLINPDLFTSGAGLGFLSSIKIVKAVRVSRILRLLRLLKVMGKIQNTDSHMANRHIAMVSTIATISFISVYSIMAFSGVLSFAELESQQENFYRQLAINIQKSAAASARTPAEQHEIARTQIADLLFDMNSTSCHLVQVYYRNRLLLSNLKEADLQSHFKYHPEAAASEKFRGDLHVHSIVEGEILMYISTWPVAREKARLNIMVFFGICAVILSFMFVYSRHFVQNVTDVIHVMRKGITEDGFNLEVAIRQDFAEDEIFQLAQTYNEKLLPEKMRQRTANAGSDTGGLSLDDFLK